VAARTCESCQKWWYDDAIDKETGRMKWSTKIVSKGPKQFERPKKPDGTLVSPAPCHECPKKSPAEAHKIELSEKNLATFDFFRRVKATNGACLTERMTEDETLMKNLVTVDAIVRAHETIAAMGGMK